MKNNIYYFILFMFCAFSLGAQNLSFGLPFSEGLVLQQQKKVNVWGMASPKEKVTLTIQDQTIDVTADEKGKWEVVLNPMVAGGPYVMRIKGKTTQKEIKELYIGEVWLASGQSNMQFRLDQNFNSSEYIQQATNKNIHFLFVPQVLYEGHHVKDQAEWHTATSEYVGRMSAVAYFFARDIQQQLQVPVGIICDYKGGTPAEAWMSQTTLTTNPLFEPTWQKYQQTLQDYGENGYESLYNDYVSQYKTYKKDVSEGKMVIRPVEPMGFRNYKRPCGLYETMLTPIIPYTFKGVIWYQGEANASRAEQYRTLFPALIEERREEFGDKKMPFYFVQLSNYNHPGYGGKPVWAELRESQLLTSQRVANTGMVVSIDCGAKDDIHPTVKEPVGKRLAALALNKTYGFKNINFSGPVYKRKKIKGNQIELTFDYTQGGLKTKGDALKGFSICGADEQFVEAEATIVGNKILVSSPKVSNPKEVRYGWNNYTDANLWNGVGFPASPFRTDDFNMITAGKN